jgi:hypothetical protein
MPLKLNFLLRVQTPTESLPAATWFDDNLTECFRVMAGITPTTLTKQIMQLPTSMGGLGLTSAVATAPHAYGASKDQALKLDIDLPRVAYRMKLATLEIHSQGKRMEHHVHKHLCQAAQATGDHIKRLLLENCYPGASAILCSIPRWSPPCRREVFAAILRLKTSTPLLCLEQLTKCNFCKAPLTSSSIVHHFAGCTKIPAGNSANAHKIAKDLFKIIFDYCGIKYEDKEPNDYVIRTCPKCKDDFPAENEAHLREHVSRCPKGVTFQQLDDLSKQRPDIRFSYSDPTNDYATRTCVLDVSMTTTLGSAGAAAVQQRVKVKRATYERLALSKGETFLAIIITNNGAMSEDCNLLAHILHQSRKSFPFQSARAAVACIGQRCRALSCYNGEMKHGAPHKNLINPMDKIISDDELQHYQAMELTHEDHTDRGVLETFADAPEDSARLPSVDIPSPEVRDPRAETNGTSQDSPIIISDSPAQPARELFEEATEADSAPASRTAQEEELPQEEEEEPSFTARVLSKAESIHNGAREILSAGSEAPERSAAPAHPAAAPTAFASEEMRSKIQQLENDRIEHPKRRAIN